MLMPRNTPAFSKHGVRFILIPAKRGTNFSQVWESNKRSFASGEGYHGDGFGLVG